MCLFVLVFVSDLPVQKVEFEPIRIDAIFWLRHRKNIDIEVLFWYDFLT